MHIRSIDDSKFELIKGLYYEGSLSVPEIAKQIGASVSATYSFFKRNNIPRRTQKEERVIRFENKQPSFTKRELNTEDLKELAAIGAMLYWGEGSKGSREKPAKVVDFTNSDPTMIRVFLKFLREVYILEEKKFRILLYCYSDQDSSSLIDFWSETTMIPREQFSKPYIRTDFLPTGRKMQYGLVHIRYGDKKLLLDIKNMIDYYVQRYAPIG